MVRSLSERPETIGDVLSRPYAVRWNHAVFARPQIVSNASCHCLVLDPDNVETEGEEEPEEARRHGDASIRSIQEIQSIAGNLEEQGGEVETDQMLRASLRYLARDAFIVLSESGR